MASILAFLYSLVLGRDEENRDRYQEMLQTSFVIGIPTLIVGVLLAFSYKKPALVDHLSAVMFLGYCLNLSLVNFVDVCGEMTTGMRR